MLRRGLLLGTLTVALAAPLVAYGTSGLPADEASPAATTSTAIVPDAARRADNAFGGFPEEAVMVLMGTTLLGIAAVVRRTTA